MPGSRLALPLNPLGPLAGLPGMSLGLLGMSARGFLVLPSRSLMMLGLASELLSLRRVCIRLLTVAGCLRRQTLPLPLTFGGPPAQGEGDQGDDDHGNDGDHDDQHGRHVREVPGLASGKPTHGLRDRLTPALGVLHGRQEPDL